MKTNRVSAPNEIITTGANVFTTASVSKRKLVCVSAKLFPVLLFHVNQTVTHGLILATLLLSPINATSSSDSCCDRDARSRRYRTTYGINDHMLLFSRRRFEAEYQCMTLGASPVQHRADTHHFNM